MTTAKKVPELTPAGDTPGLMRLEYAIDTAHRALVRKKMSTIAVAELRESLSGDLRGRAPEGMKLLVRVALAARQDHRGGCAPETCGGMSLDPCSLANALEAFERWEKSL